MRNNIKSSIQKGYSNPYLAGVGLGLTLLAAFVIMGRGLGASGGFTTIVSTAVDFVSPAHAEANGLYQPYLDNKGDSPLKDWMVFEILGVLLGGLVSGLLAGRVKKEVVKGDRISTLGRLTFAFCGGTLMGFAAKIARGCTSGQALTGGALLSVGSWVFMISLFAGAFGIAYFFRRQWL
jgi:hypothetical protein